MRRKKREDRTFPVMTVCAGILAVFLFGIILLWPQETENTFTDYEEAKEDAVFWNGKQYTYNDHLTNYLFLGVDRREAADTHVGQTDAGQADALFLLSRDRVTGSLTLISIPRDTITPVEAYGPEGESLGVSSDHINRSYGYGDGAHESCRMAKEAVSTLMYDLPIQKYCAVGLDALPVLAAAVGTLEVTVPNDSLADTELVVQKGDVLLLDESNIETFVRRRDIEKTGSAIERLERQQAFLSAWYDVFQEEAEANPGKVTELYEELKPYLTTNMDGGEFADLMEDAGKTQIQNWTLPGENVEGTYYDEYHVDDSALYEKIMETFYTEI